MTIPSIVPIGKAKPVDDVVERLEELLASARKGELRTIVYVGEEYDGAYVTGACGPRSTLRTIGMISRMLHREQVSADNEPSLD